MRNLRPDYEGEHGVYALDVACKLSRLQATAQRCLLITDLYTDLMADPSTDLYTDLMADPSTDLDTDLMADPSTDLDTGPNANLNTHLKTMLKTVLRTVSKQASIEICTGICIEAAFRSQTIAWPTRLSPAPHCSARRRHPVPRGPRGGY